MTIFTKSKIALTRQGTYCSAATDCWSRPVGQPTCTISRQAVPVVAPPSTTRRVPLLLVCASVLSSTPSLHCSQQPAGWASRTDYVAVGRDGMVVCNFASQAIADTTAAHVFIDPNRAVAEHRESNNAQTSELVCERQ